MIERGYRQYLYDADGRAYLDLINNVAIVGHSHPRVTLAAAHQLERLNTNTRFLYSALPQLAERLAALVPAPLEVVYLTNSGSEANDLALQLARHASGQRDVLCPGGYHGWTIATDALRRASRDLGRPQASAEEWVHPVELVEDGDGNGSGLDVEATLAELARAGRAPAAFISEPVLGNWGGVTLPAGTLEAVYGLVRRAGGVCIADEVQVGYGRLGDHFWGFEQQGVVPDIVTIAKATGNGHPVAAVITTRAIADGFARGGYFFASTAGSPVSCAVALAVLDVIEDERLQQNARDVGAYLTERLEPLVERFPLVRAIHGLGLYRGLELSREGDRLRPAREEAAAICERLRTLGIITQPTGDGGNVLKIKPPLCVGAADIDLLADALATTLDDDW